MPYLAICSTAALSSSASFEFASSDIMLHPLLRKRYSCIRSLVHSTLHRHRDGLTCDHWTRRRVVNIISPDVQRTGHAVRPNGEYLVGNLLDSFTTVGEPAQQVAGGNVTATTELL